MIARDTTEDAIERAATLIGVRFGCDGIRAINQRRTAFRFTLRPIMPDKRPAREYGRYFRRGLCNHDRTVAAVCWHGHRDFFRKLFKVCPTARVQTRATRSLDKGDRYYTADNFERVYDKTDTNIGSAYSPLMYSDACWCGDTMIDRVTERLTGVNPSWLTTPMYPSAEDTYDSRKDQS